MNILLLTTIFALGINSVVSQRESNLEECGIDNSPAGFRVVGGQDALECQYPWMVYIYNEVTHAFCGGSILDKRHILTASHCVVDDGTLKAYPASNFKVYSGSSRNPMSFKGVKKHTVEKIIHHEDYFIDKYDDDIAVVRLSTSLKFDRCQRPICLSDGSRNVQSFKDCRVMGWNRLYNHPSKLPENLQWTTERAVSAKECAKEYGQSSTKKTFCSIGEMTGVCNGDSGGPLACKHEDGKFYQYGIVSGGRRRKCGIRLSLFTYINAYGDWIKDAIGSVGSTGGATYLTKPEL